MAPKASAKVKAGRQSLAGFVQTLISIRFPLAAAEA